MGNAIHSRYFLIHGSCDGLESTLEIDTAKSLSQVASEVNAHDTETIFSVWAYDHADRQMKDVTVDVATQIALNSYWDGESPSFASIDLIDSYGFAYFGHYDGPRIHSGSYADYQRDMRVAAG